MQLSCQSRIPTRLSFASVVLADLGILGCMHQTETGSLRKKKRRNSRIYLSLQGSNFPRQTQNAQLTSSAVFLFLVSRASVAVC